MFPNCYFQQTKGWNSIIILDFIFIWLLLMSKKDFLLIAVRGLVLLRVKQLELYVINWILLLNNGFLEVGELDISLRFNVLNQLIPEVEQIRDNYFFNKIILLRVR